jgi:hypothetical protein
LVLQLNDKLEVSKGLQTKKVVEKIHLNLKVLFPIECKILQFRIDSVEWKKTKKRNRTFAVKKSKFQKVIRHFIDSFPYQLQKNVSTLLN